MMHADELLTSFAFGGGSGGPAPSGTKEVSITQNGTTTEDVAEYASAEITVAVPNSYAAGDEGKVVSNGELVSQSSATKTENGTYDTTLNNEIVVNVPSTNKEAEILQHTINGSYTNASVLNLPTYALFRCKNIEELHLPNCEAVQSYAVQMQSNDASVMRVLDLPNATQIGQQGFVYCGSGLASGVGLSLNLPKVDTISSSAFSNSGAGPTLTLPACKSVGYSAFGSNAKLETVDLAYDGSGSNLSIEASAWNGCSSLTALIIRQERVATLAHVSALTGTPIASGTGYIYVPDGQKASYQAAANWSTYANQFRSLESYTVDGTITGALDPTKI